MTSTACTDLLERDGFAVVPVVLDEAACDDLLALLPAPDDDAPLRRLLDMPEVARLAAALIAHPALAAAMPHDARPVQCTYFDKSGERNWSVGPHQDLALPLPAGAQRLPEDWRAASQKDGLEFGQPPASTLAHVLAVRLQLDATSEDDGALEVIPGTHRQGRLDPETLADLARRAERLPCPVPRGGALLLRPLLVHGSRRLRAGARRRVLHFVFAPKQAA